MDFLDRQKSYENAYDYTIINRLPIIIRCDARNFTKISKQVEHPFDQQVFDLFAKTLFHTITDMDGAVFGFHFNDEFTFILKNVEDQCWYQNKIQKLASITASICSTYFLKNSLAEGPDLDGDAIFDAKVFAVPSFNEAVNNIILRQQECMLHAINRAAYDELIKIYGKEKTIKLLYGKKSEEKIDLLQNECDIIFNEYYPSAFRRGLAAYKVPKIIHSKEGDITRNKWALDYEVPIFALDRNFLSNIIYSGHDIVRADRDLIQ